MYFDTTHNAHRTVLANIHSAFSETATKMWAYMRCLPRDMQPTPGLIIRKSRSRQLASSPHSRWTLFACPANSHTPPTGTIHSLIDAAFQLLRGKARRARYPGYRCDVERGQVAWLALHAFKEVLGRKQAAYREVIMWLDAEMAKLGAKRGTKSARLSRVAAIAV